MNMEKNVLTYTETLYNKLKEELKSNSNTLALVSSYAIIYTDENTYREERIESLELTDWGVLVHTTESTYRLRNDDDLYFMATILSIALELELVA